MAPPRQLAFLFADEPASEARESEASVVSRRPAPPVPAGPPRRPTPPHASPDSARVLAEALGQRLGVPVRLVVTDNRSAMFSARKRDGRMHVRANHIFLDAAPEIVDAMAAAVRRDPEARARLRTFIRVRRARIRPSERKARRTHLRTRGAHHDLAHIFDQLEMAYFPDTMTGVRITWGPALGRRRRRRRSIQLGLYIPDDRLIRIHRALDQDWVPAFYVESVVFHEMLHHCMPPVRRGRQVVFHTPQFRALEKVFPFHAEAERWEKLHLDRLLGS